MPNGNNNKIEYHIGIITKEGNYIPIEKGKGHEALIFNYFKGKYGVKYATTIIETEMTFKQSENGIVLRTVQDRNQKVRKCIFMTSTTNVLLESYSDRISAETKEHIEAAKLQGWEVEVEF